MLECLALFLYIDVVQQIEKNCYIHEGRLIRLLLFYADAVECIDYQFCVLVDGLVDVAHAVEDSDEVLESCCALF